MYKGWYQYCKHLRFLFFHPIFLIALLVFGVSDFFIFSSQLNADALDSLYTTNAIVHTVSLAMASYTMVRLHFRTFHSSQNDWIQAYPGSPIALALANFLAAFTYMSLYSCLIFIVFFIKTKLSLPSITYQPFMKLLVENGVRLEISYFLTLSIGLLIAVLLKNKWVAYGMSFFVWILGTYALEVMVGKFHWLPLKLFHFNHYFLEGRSLVNEPLWGNALFHHETVVSLTFITVFALLIMTIAFILLIWRRPTKQRITTSFLAIILLFICCYTSNDYLEIWTNKYQQAYSNNGIQQSEGIASNLSSSISATSYTINVFHSKDTLTINTEMILDISRKTNESIVLTLNPNFKVEEVLVNNHKASFTRHRATLTLDDDHLKAGDKEAKVSLIYSGKIAEWDINSEGDERYFAFFKGMNAYLPSYMAWYPLVGAVNLYPGPQQSPVRSQAADHTQADFSVTLHGFQQYFHSTSGAIHWTFNKDQTITAPKTSGVSLLSGNFNIQHYGQLEIILPSTISKAHAAEIYETYAFLNKALQNDLDITPNGEFLYLPLKDIVDDSQQSQEPLLLDNAFIIDSAQTVDAVSRKKQILNPSVQFQYLGYLLTHKDLKSYTHPDREQKDPNDTISLVTLDALNYILQEEAGSVAPTFVLAPSVQNSVAFKNVQQAVAQKQFEPLKQVLSELCDKKFKDHIGLPTITNQEWREAWKHAFQ
ncbi:hypothetical protein JOD43_000711 [Pullulanibacillus pueri]|uniref:Uncharacterized protein n=1 Tax=Pullulanibacillus pueri TaxID=1437324 RepID=A0A8J3A012_9BACL|nr:hypothetical protein [Pullulanibacillus pueri]MBM7680549.1 hypothetical protein [Pullulanibacillus pueri]GGH88398.1 hypothetical protein GCM10007096_40640 [Pullulanibacillus pueri]